MRAEPVRVAGAALLLFALTVWFQWRNDAFARDFAFDADSHALSGLMIHDYLLSYPWRSPLAYLRDYHSHYPLIGIGHWPPLWYAVEAIWMLVLGASRWSLLMLSAAVTGGTATILAALTARRYGWVAGLIAGGMFVAANMVQENTADVLLDGAVAFVCLLAMLAYARFMQTSRLRDGALFGLLASAAILVKGNGALLALLPPLAVLIGRRWDLMRRAGFWVPIPIVAVLAGAWSAVTYGQVSAGFRYSWGFAFFRDANVADWGFLVGALGWLVVAVALLGMLAVIVTPGLRRDPVLVAGTALVLATWLFQAIVPVALQDRYLIPLLPPVLLLMMTGAATLGSRVPPLLVRRTAPLLLLASMIPFIGHLKLFPLRGAADAAAAVWTRRIAANPAVLVAAQDEGALIVELALRDPHRPSLFAVRGSRLLGGGGYNQADYLPRFSTPAAAMSAVDDYALPMVLLRTDGGTDEWAHLRQLVDARTEAPDRWQLVWEERTPTPPIELYLISGNDQRPADQSRLLRLSAPKGLGD